MEATNNITTFEQHPTRADMQRGKTSVGVSVPTCPSQIFDFKPNIYVPKRRIILNETPHYLKSEVCNII